MTEVAGKRALITGAANGIGRLMAIELAKLGADIVVWDIDTAGLVELGRKIEPMNVNFNAYECDLSDKNAIARTAQTMCEDQLHVDILINNAGVIAGSEFLELSDEQIERTMAINTMALFWVSRAFLQGMVNNAFGHIVTVASAAALTGTARQVDYSASKFAAMGFDEALRVELHAIGSPVKTTLICPYYISTDMFKGVTTRFTWLLPRLQPEYVVRRTVNAIVRNQRRVIMPRAVYSLFAMRLLPVSWMDAALRFLGISQGMSTYVGRNSTAASSDAVPADKGVR